MCESYARLDGHVAVVTGGSVGIGFEVAKNLAQLGARVIIASRSETKLSEARQKIVAETGNNNVDYKIFDLASLTSVRNLAYETIKFEKRLDILINNAGAVALPDKLSEDGLNLTMQVNYFGAFLLTYLLLPLLKSSAPSRIINGSAASMYIGEVNFNHWNDIGRYSSIGVLANSKLADYLFTVELDRRLKNSGVTANSFDPFVVSDTEIMNNVPGFIRMLTEPIIRLIGQSKENVGKQIAYLAAEPSLENVSGEHFKFCGKWLKHWLSSDEALTSMLWEESKKIVNITPEEDWELNGI